MSINKTKFASTRKNEASNSVHIPYLGHIDHTTIETTEGDLLRVYKLEGLSHETADIEDVNGWKTTRNGFYKNISSPKVGLWKHIVRRKVDSYPEGDYEGFAKRLNDKYKESLDKDSMYINELYLTVVVKAFEGPAALKKASQKGKSQDAKQYDRNVLLEYLNDICTNFEKTFKNYELTTLSVYEENEVLFSSAYEFLNYLIDGAWCKIPVTYHAANKALGVCRTFFGKEAGETRSINSELYFGALGVKEYSANTRAGMLDECLKLPFEFVITQTFCFMQKQKAVEDFIKQQNRMINAGDLAGSQIDEIDQLLDDLVSNRLVVGEHHLTFLAKAEDTKKLGENLASAFSALGEAGLTLAREDLALENSFWAQLPANFSYRPRVSPITSINFSGFASFHNFPSGKLKKNHWGDAATLLKTSSGTPYFFNFHKGDLGNATVIGPSGTGKTVLMGFLMCLFEKYRPRVAFFDKDRGAEIFIRANRGNYSAIQQGVPTGFNPLQLDPSKPSNIAFMNEWVKKLVTTNGETLTAQETNEISNAIQGVIKMPVELRRLLNLEQFLDGTKEDGLVPRLQAWHGHGKYAWAFDNGSDSLNLENRINGFDITELLDNPEIRTPILMYLFHVIDGLIDGTRFMMFIDEGWKAIADKYFNPIIKDLEKTIRKRNGMVIFGSNDAADATKSDVGHVIINQSPTQIFMPNPKAKHQDYVEGFGLTDKEYKIIKELPEKSRQFLIKHGMYSVVAELNLKGFDEEIAVLSGTEANVNLLDEVRARVGDNPDDWLPVFLEERRNS